MNGENIPVRIDGAASGAEDYVAAWVQREEGRYVVDAVLVEDPGCGGIRAVSREFVEADSTGLRCWIIRFGFIMGVFCVEGVGVGVDESEGDRGCYEDASGENFRENW